MKPKVCYGCGKPDPDPVRLVRQWYCRPCAQRILTKATP